MVKEAKVLDRKTPKSGPQAAGVTTQRGSQVTVTSEVRITGSRHAKPDRFAMRMPESKVASASFTQVLRAAAELVRAVGTAVAFEILTTGRRAVGERTSLRTPTPRVAREADEQHKAERWLELRTDFLNENKAVTAPELARITGSQVTNSSARAYDWAKTGRIFSVHDGTGERFPLFQLRDGQPIPEVATVLKILRPKLSNWQVAFWFTTSNAWTGGWRTPAELLASKPETVTEVAQHEVAEQVF